MLIGLHVQIHTQYGERGRLEIDQLFEQLCGSGLTGERILGVDWFSGSRHGFGQLTRLLQHAECQTGTQLTKRAPLGGDSETRTLKGPGEATWASRRAVLTKRTSLLRLVADMKYGRGGHGPYGGVRIIQEELQFGEGRPVAARRQALSGSRAHAPTGIRKGPFQ